MVLSTLLQNCVVLFPFPSEPRGPLSIYLLQSLVVHSFLQSRMVSSPFTFGAAWSPPLPQNLVVLPTTLEPRGLSSSPPNLVVLPTTFGAAWSLLPLWLPGLGLNPSAQLPLQPHFRLLLQLAIPASIPVFPQLFWAAIVSPDRRGPVAWSQSSASSYAGAVTRRSCLPVTSLVEVTPIPLAQSMATAI